MKNLKVQTVELPTAPISLRCPFCKAKPGRDCTNVLGRYAALHVARIKATAAKDSLQPTRRSDANPLTEKHIEELISLVERTADICRKQGGRLQQIASRLDDDSQGHALAAIADAFTSHAMTIERCVYNIRQDFRQTKG